MTPFSSKSNIFRCQLCCDRSTLPIKNRYDNLCRYLFLTYTYDIKCVLNFLKGCVMISNLKYLFNQLWSLLFGRMDISNLNKQQLYSKYLLLLKENDRVSQNLEAVRLELKERGSESVIWLVEEMLVNDLKD